MLIISVLIVIQFSLKAIAENECNASSGVKICTTPGCVKAASKLLGSMDTSKDPCNNFYEYACGQWIKDNPIPDDLSIYTTYMVVRETVAKQLRTLLEKNDTSSSSKSTNMVKKIYRSCMDDSLKKTKSEPLIVAVQTLGGWPLLDSSWTDAKLDFTDFLARVRRLYDAEIFVDIEVPADVRNVTNTILSIDQAILGLGFGTRNYYLNDTLYGKQMAAYKQFMLNTIRLLTTDSNITMTPQMETDVDQIVAFEREFAMITVPEENRRNITRRYNKWSINDLADAVPFIDWITYFKIIMPDDVFALTSDPQFLLNVAEPNFMMKLQSLFKQTDKRVVKGLSSYLAHYDDIAQIFLKAMSGREQKPVRWKLCVPQAVYFMDMAVSELYVSEYFKKEDKTEASSMIKNIQQSFKDIVNDLDWMNNATKQFASEKVDAMLDHIGYPDFILNVTALDEYYSNLNFSDNDNYFHIILKAALWKQGRDLSELLKPFDRQKFQGSPTDVNAGYRFDRNALTFPAGILQPPFFKGDFPKAVNYGAIGAIIGHEITHGFDDRGRQFGKIGNLQDWWSSSASEKFRQKAKCIIDQYDNYTVPEINVNVNGKLTQGENIADNGGIRQAFRAYKKYLQDLGSEEGRLPGLESMTNEQIFFLSFANFFCGLYKPGYAISQILTDPHSPLMFRVIGPLSNFEEFSNAFQCPKNSVMNPDPLHKPRCSIW